MTKLPGLHDEKDPARNALANTLQDPIHRAIQSYTAIYSTIH